MDTSSNDNSTTLANRVYHALQVEITTGQIRPGQRLVRREIARRLGVSPIPVIEALLRLEQDGLVESKPNCGARAIAITPETIVNECMLREAIECQVARLLATTADKDQMDELETAARRLDGLMQRGDPNSVIGMELHMEFHLRLARLTGFPLLEQHLHGIWVRHLMQLNWVNSILDPVPKGWHALLVSILRRREPGEAEEAMRKHVRYGQQTLSEAIRRLTEPSPD
jgi:DNA-binding GntR family transcriptional regulator